MMKKVFLLLLIFSVGFLVYGEKIAKFDEIFKLRSFHIDGDTLYVVDGYEIKLFSLKDAKLITTFGKRGEGPGEFPGHPQIQVLPDKVFVRVMGKILFFEKDGKFISESKVPPFNIYYKVKQNLLLEESITNENMTEEKVYVKVLDSELKIVRDIFTDERKLPAFSRPGENTKQKRLLFENKKIPTTDGEYIYVFDTFKGFYIDIYDHEGLKINTIDIDTPKIPVSDKDKEGFINRLKENKNWDNMNKMFDFVFPEYYPSIQWVHGDQKRLYVSTFKRVDDKKEIVILNFQGEIIKKILVPKMEHYVFSNNKYFYFNENEEDEVWELHMIDL